MSSKGTVYDVNGMIRFYKNIAKQCKNGRFHISILSARNYLNKLDYLGDLSPKDEKYACQCDDNRCYLHKFEDLRDYLAITLIIENGGECVTFDVKTFDSHKYQNCYIVYSYLEYLYNNSLNSNSSKIEKNIITKSDELFDKYKSNYIGYFGEYVPKVITILTDEDNSFPILSGSVVSPGVSFSNVVKSSEVVKNEPSEFDDILNEIDELRSIKSKYDALLADYEKVESENKKLKAYATKTKIELDTTKTELNRYKVKFETLISKLKK